MWATDEGFNYESLPKQTTHQHWFPLGVRGAFTQPRRRVTNDVCDDE